LHLPGSVFVELFRLRESIFEGAAIGKMVNVDIVESEVFDCFELPGTFNVELDIVLLSFGSEKLIAYQKKNRMHFLFEVSFFGRVVTHAFKQLL
jgi:hypothetical protein